MIRRIALLSTVALLCACDRLAIDPMKRQPKYKSYAPSELFSDGRAMRSPPEGTVPRERPQGVPALLEGRIGSAPVAQLPVPLTWELLTRGQRRFEITCAACHGLLGDGTSVVASKMSQRTPPSLHEPRLRDAPAGALYRAITFGFGLMPSYATEIPVEERWAVVAYVRALQRSQSAKIDDIPTETRLQLEEMR